MEKNERILILDFGGQYTQLIARRVRECHVYSEVLPWNTPLEDILARHPRGLILSGGPAGVHDPGAPGSTQRSMTPGSPFWASAMACS